MTTSTSAESLVRVGYLTGEYPRATDTWLQREIAGLRAQGVDVHTFSIRRPDSAQLVDANQVAERDRTTYVFERLATPGLARTHARLLGSSPRRYLSALRLMWATHRPGMAGTLRQIGYFLEAGVLTAELTRRHIGHVHNHFGDSSCSVAMLAAHMGGLTYSFTLHGPGIFLDPHGWRLPEKIARASFCVCISHFCRAQAAAIAGPDQIGQTHVIHCGVDAAERSTVAHFGHGLRLVFVGRLAKVKGVTLLLDAVAQVVETHESVHLTIIGDGPERSELESLAGRKGLDRCVTFTGYLSPADVVTALGDSDIFVLPSFAEGVPVSIMEAMASELAVVASDVGGVRELVEDGYNGLLIRPGDVDQLVEHLLALIADPKLRARLGAAGRATILERFDLADQVASLRALFTSVAPD